MCFIFMLKPCSPFLKWEYWLVRNANSLIKLILSYDPKIFDVMVFNERSELVFSANSPHDIFFLKLFVRLASPFWIYTSWIPFIDSMVVLLCTNWLCIQSLKCQSLRMWIPHTGIIEVQSQELIATRFKFIPVRTPRSS